MQYPPSSVPFVEYVLKAIEHPPHMFVSKLAACCAMLFLTRSDTELLRTLSYKWATRFHMDRKKLMESLRRRAQKSFKRHSNANMSQDSTREMSLIDEKANQDEAVEHLMRILNSLILTYFSWNWHKTDYVIQINKEYEALIRENILPLCIVTSPEDGVDDPTPTPWLIPLFHTSPVVFSPTARNGPGSMAEVSGLASTEPREINSGTSLPIRIRGSTMGDGENNQSGSLRAFPAPFAPRSATNSKVPAYSKGSLVGSPFLSDRGKPSFLSPDRIVSTPTDEGSVLSLDASTVFSDASMILMTLSNYREIMRRNHTGILMIFHARFSVKSNEVMDVLQEIVQRKPLNPMPTVAVVYSVTEPELASMYSIRFIPTIVYTPPSGNLSSSVMSQSSAKRIPLEESNSDIATNVNSAVRRSSSIRLAAPLSSSLPRPSPVPLAESGSNFSPTEVLYGFKVKTNVSPSTPSPAPGATPTTGEQRKDAFLCISNNNHNSIGLNEQLTSSTLSEDDSSYTLFIDEDEDDHTELQDMLNNDNHITYPMEGLSSYNSIVEWIETFGAKKPQLQKNKNFVARMNSVRAEEKFKRERELHSALVLLRRLQGISQQPNVPSTTPQDGPLFIFLGGGMAAGKTTAASALAQSAWWKDHKEQSVVVNADEFKVFNPLVDSTRPDVHARSTKAAESLLVQAINQGRSIVYDSTMMWEPYINQVVDMVRHAHLSLYKQGRGYLPEVGIEEYFVPAEERRVAMHMPYRIHFLGITVEPEIAVPRGFIRKFTTGRGVPIPTQLRSFKYFAKSFSHYASLMDSTTLYDNNVYVDLDKGELPPVMAECNIETGNKLRIRDEAAYQQFMKQTSLNEDADNIMEIYGSSQSSQPNACWSPSFGSPNSRSVSRDMPN